MAPRLVLPLALLLALACTGGPAPDTAAPAADQDVRGIYALSWADTLTIRLDIGGAVQEVTAGSDEVVTFEGPDGAPLELDLAAYCADAAVTCPSEAWPARVSIDEDDPAVVMDAHVLRAWDADVPGTVVSGLVDHRDDRFLFGLDGASGSSGDCGALAVSLAGGRFWYPEAEEAADTNAADTGGADTAGVEGIDGGVAAAPGGPTGIVDGEVALGWLGVCAWEGLAVAATLTVSSEYDAVRVGDLAP